MNTLQLVKKLIRIPSVFPHEQVFAEFLSEYLENRGFHIERVPTSLERDNIIATFGTANTYIAFYGHMDTVPADVRYKKDPFMPVVKNNRVYGLGSADMKGGITAMLELASFAVEKNLPVKIVFGVDEENISQGAHDLVSSGRMRDISFLISAESGQIKDHQSPYSLCLGRKGRLFLQLQTQGKRTHAAEEHGVNAIETMALLLSRFSSLRFPSHKMLGDTRIVIHSISGNTDSFSIPDVCSVTISVLTNPYTSLDDIRKKLIALGNTLGIALAVVPVERATPYGESYVIDTQDSFFKQLQTHVFSPDKIEGIYTDSVADENVFANRLHIPVISLGPIGYGDHVVDEWVSLSSITYLIQTYKKILSLFHSFPML